MSGPAITRAIPRTISKHVQTGIGPVGLDVPRDRAGTFEPLLIPKRSGRISGGLDDMIISLYAHVISSALFDVYDVNAADTLVRRGHVI